MHVVVHVTVDEVGDVVAAPERRAALREVRPAVLVRVKLRIVDAGVDERVLVLLLPPVFHEVVVGRDLAEVLVRVEVAMDLALRVDRHVARYRVRLRRTRQEVVDHQLVLARTRLRRVEEREAVVDAVRGRTERKQVFGVVGEAVVVGIVLCAVLRDAPEVLPPVGDVVAVDVSGRGVGRIERAVRLQAAGEVYEVGLVGRHLDAKVVDRRIPVQRNLGIEVRAVVLAGILLPPVGKSVAGRVALRLLPGFGRRAVVPHLRTGLRVRTAERQQVGRADEAAADVVAVHVEDRLVGVAAQVEEPVQGEKLDVAVNPVVGARIRHRVVREHELVDAVRHRRQFLIPRQRIDRHGVDLDAALRRLLCLMAPVNLVAHHIILIGVAQFVGFGVGDEQDAACGTMAPRSLLHYLLYHQLIELVAVASAGILGILYKLYDAVLIPSKRQTLIGVAEIILAVHVAIVAESHDAETQVVIVLEESWNKVGHLTAHVVDICRHRTGGVEGNHHIEHSHLLGSDVFHTLLVCATDSCSRVLYDSSFFLCIENLFHNGNV